MSTVRATFNGVTLAEADDPPVVEGNCYFLSQAGFDGDLETRAITSWREENLRRCQEERSTPKSSASERSGSCSSRSGR